jgi:isoleucyl-tRNA synthetase
VLARVFKDVFPRYKTMKGYYVPRKAGWDTHGLPVELEIEKNLGLSSKAQIEEYGVAEFNRRCRESVFRYLSDWKRMTQRIGFWLDMEHPYVTLENDYIESGWWIVKQLWDKSLIYEGYRVAPHCPRCGTSLSSHEVALGYEETDDPSIYVKFKLAPLHSQVSADVRELLSSPVPAFFLAWTTTPWTLPGNTALAVAAEAEYSVVEVADEYLILASALIEQAGLGGHKTIATLPGAELSGLHYEPLYKIPLGYSEGDKPAYRLIQGDFVSMNEGTGSKW